MRSSWRAPILALLVLLGACHPSGTGRPFEVRSIAPTTTTTAVVTTTTEAPQPPPTQPPRASRSQAHRSPPTTAPEAYSGLRFGWTDDPFDALSACEAGMNPRRVSASGKYRGAFQWDLGSWHGLGETGDPIDYDYAYQKGVAQRMQAARGWSPWPTCSRKLGLR